VLAPSSEQGGRQEGACARYDRQAAAGAPPQSHMSAVFLPPLVYIQALVGNAPYVVQGRGYGARRVAEIASRVGTVGALAAKMRAGMKVAHTRARRR